jgi:hypothetical protein
MATQQQQLQQAENQINRWMKDSKGLFAPQKLKLLSEVALSNLRRFLAHCTTETGYYADIRNRQERQGMAKSLVNSQQAKRSTAGSSSASRTASRPSTAKKTSGGNKKSGTNRPATQARAQQAPQVAQTPPTTTGEQQNQQQNENIPVGTGD